MPYVAHVDENTIDRTPASTMTSSSCSVLTVLLWKYLRGCVIDSPTYALAAKCTPASIRWRRTTSATHCESDSSPRSNGPHFTAHSCPLDRLSTTSGV